MSLISKKSSYRISLITILATLAMKISLMILMSLIRTMSLMRSMS